MCHLEREYQLHAESKPVMDDNHEFNAQDSSTVGDDVGSGADDDHAQCRRIFKKSPLLRKGCNFIADLNWMLILVLTIPFIVWKIWTLNDDPSIKVPVPIGPVTTTPPVQHYAPEDMPSRKQHAMCDLPAVREFFESVESRCVGQSCESGFDFERMGELLGVLRNSGLQVVHVFPPENRSAYRVERGVGVSTVEKLSALIQTELRSTSGAISFYVFSGPLAHHEQSELLNDVRARVDQQVKGSDADNRDRPVRWLAVPLQRAALSKSDARLLDIEPRRYGNDLGRLHRAIHFVVYPCVLAP